MIRLWFVVGLLALAFWVYSIVDCAVQPPVRHRGVSKGAWIAIVVLVPVIGGILWFTIGRYRANGTPVAQRPAPEDDPQFWRGMSRTEQDDRIRRLEEELARLDDETDGTPDTRS